MRLIRNLNPLTILIFCFTLLNISSCRNEAVKNGMLIITEAPAAERTPNYLTGEDWRYIRGTRIVAFTADKQHSARILTSKFNSAASPDISYDGRSMLFSAVENQGDAWQIWEMNLDNLKAKKITATKDNCIDPVYLPDGRIAFSKLTINDTVKNAHCIFSCNPDGSDLRQLTFSPEANFASTVLRDGRILTVNMRLQQESTVAMLMVMRPDGTKADMFYKPEPGTKLSGNVSETDDGRLMFIETSDGKANVVSISYNRPLHTHTELSSGLEGEFNYILPLNSGKYIASFRKSSSGLFALFEFDPDKKTIGNEVFSEKDYSVIDVAAADAYMRPKKLPSEVDMMVKTGLLLCQDINYLNPSDMDIKSGHLKADRIEVLGIDTTYGVAKVEEDGSFYLKVMADTPFRIRTLDKEGKVINGPCTWIWLRPNERRGCVGCHEDPETVPDNKVSFAINKPPVIIPVHIADVKEKIVDLE